METGRRFKYVDDRISADGGCEAAFTDRTICGLVKLRQCGDLLCGRFTLMLNEAVYMNYVSLAILYVGKEWCLKEIGYFTKDRKIHAESSAWSTDQG